MIQLLLKPLNDFSYSYNLVINGQLVGSGCLMNNNYEDMKEILKAHEALLKNKRKMQNYCDTAKDKCNNSFFETVFKNRKERIDSFKGKSV